jgi:hypothetical protein
MMTCRDVVPVVSQDGGAIMRLLTSHAGAFFTIATLLLLRNLLRAVGASFLRALPKSKPAAKPTAAHLLRRPAQRAEVQSQPGYVFQRYCQGIADHYI